MKTKIYIFIGDFVKGTPLFYKIKDRINSEDLYSNYNASLFTLTPAKNCLLKIDHLASVRLNDDIFSSYEQVFIIIDSIYNYQKILNENNFFENKQNVYVSTNAYRSVFPIKYSIRGSVDTIEEDALIKNIFRSGALRELGFFN
jgi:hypothetical protein